MHACGRIAGSGGAHLTGELLGEGSVRRSLRCVLSASCCSSWSTKLKRSLSTACISMISAQHHENCVSRCLPRHAASMQSAEACSEAASSGRRCWSSVDTKWTLASVTPDCLSLQWPKHRLSRDVSLPENPPARFSLRTSSRTDGQAAARSGTGTADRLWPPASSGPDVFDTG